MEKSESRIAPSIEAASDDFASPSSPQPGEAADRLAFDPVPLRYREDGLTPEKQRAYVEALADCGIAREAAARVGLTEQAINRVRRRADAGSFDRACEAAHLLGARRIRSVAWERAIEGTVRGRYYHGELVAEERVFDNRLLTYLYGKVAHLLEPRQEALAICDNWEGHMEAIERGLPPPDDASADDLPHGFEIEQVWQDDTGLWRTSFPPPAGFEGEENRVWNGIDWYERSLSSQEQAVMEARCDEEDAEALAAQAASRDRFFGFEGGISSRLEAETCETSEPSGPDQRPIEYKSAFPPDRTPCPILSSAMKVHAEARRRGGAWHFVRKPASPPEAAADLVHPASPEESWTRGALRASAPPREPRPDPEVRPRHIQTPPPRHPYR